MSDAPVTVSIQDNELIPYPVPGVVVHIYEADSSVLVTGGTTDINGRVGFLLPEASYDLRCFKHGLFVLTGQPQRLVVNILQSNHFLVTGHMKTSPESPDPFLCRISGYVRGGDGRVTRNAKLAMSPLPEPLVIGGEIVVPDEHMYIISNNEGYFEFDLYRNVKYEAFFVAKETFMGGTGRLEIEVPNFPSMSIDRLLFPLPVGVFFSSAFATLGLDGPQNDLVEGSVLFSDGSIRTRFPPWTTIKLVYTDETIVEAALVNGKLNLKPLREGSTGISVERVMGKGVLWSPAPDFVSGLVTVTVIP